MDSELSYPTLDGFLTYLKHKGAVTFAIFRATCLSILFSTRVLTLQSYSLDGCYTGQRFLQFVSLSMIS